MLESVAFARFTLVMMDKVPDKSSAKKLPAQWRMLDVGFFDMSAQNQTMCCTGSLGRRHTSSSRARSVGTTGDPRSDAKRLVQTLVHSIVMLCCAVVRHTAGAPWRFGGLMAR